MTKKYGADEGARQKTPQGQLNEEETGKLPGREFREMTVKMMQNLNNKKECKHRLRKYKKCLTKRRFKQQQNQTHNTITEMKNT